MGPEAYPRRGLRPDNAGEAQEQSNCHPEGALRCAQGELRDSKDPSGDIEILRGACPERSEWAQDDSRCGINGNQSDSATAPRRAEKLTRRKSRFIRVIVSMLISLGHASWHSP